jgi:hypothetical protein
MTLLPFLGVSSLMNCRAFGRGFFLICAPGAASSPDRAPVPPRYSDIGPDRIDPAGESCFESKGRP